MNLNRYLDIAPEVKKALDEGRPVVALESTIISHGMPYPQNVETALNVEKIIRDHGAVPATIAIIKGRLKAGLSAEEIDYLGKTGAGVAKASRRDLAVLVSQEHGRRDDRHHDDDDRRTWPASRSLPPAASAAYTAAPRRRWTSPPTSRSWRTRPSWSSARARRPFSTSA